MHRIHVVDVNSPTAKLRWLNEHYDGEDPSGHLRSVSILGPSIQWDITLQFLVSHFLGALLYGEDGSSVVVSIQKQNPAASY